jgi:hypothetical protein
VTLADYRTLPPNPAAATITVEDAASVRRESFTSLVRGTGPRLARDGLAPIIVFYAGWKLLGLGAGIGLASVVSLAAFGYERRRNRSGMVAGVSLLFLLLQAAQALVGILTDSVTVYLAQGVMVSGASGVTFLGSVVVRRPLAGMFGQEVFPFPAAVRGSAMFRRVFGRISVAWGVYLIVRCGIRLAILLTGHIELFLLTGILTGVPGSAALMSWSLWYGVRGFRHIVHTGALPGSNVGSRVSNG